MIYDKRKIVKYVCLSNNDTRPLSTLLTVSGGNGHDKVGITTALGFQWIEQMNSTGDPNIIIKYTHTKTLHNTPYVFYDIYLNPSRAKFFRGNKNIYEHFMSFLHIDMTRAVEIVPRVIQELAYSI